MTPEKCPGCGTKLEPDMLACPNCPMSFPEDEPAPGVHPLKETRWYAWLLPAGFFVGLGLIVWYLGSGLMRLGEENSAVEKSPALFGGPAPASSETASAQIAVPWESTAAAKTDQEESSTQDEDAAPAQGGDTLVISSVPDEKPKPKKPVLHWRLRGTVYDLVSLRPVPGCRIVFIDQQENARIETRSDSSGRYKALVAPLGGRGYQVSIAKSGYALTYLDPATRDVRAIPAAKRRQTARDLASMLSETPYEVQPDSEKPLITDFYLAPQN